MMTTTTKYGLPRLTPKPRTYPPCVACGSRNSARAEWPTVHGMKVYCLQATACHRRMHKRYR